MASRLVRKVVPLFDRVLVEKTVATRTTSGGIMLPESAVQKLNEGKVVAIGKGKRTADGSFITPTIKVGDHVMLGEYGGNEVKMNGKDYLLIREEEILGILEESAPSSSEKL